MRIVALLSCLLLTGCLATAEQTSSDSTAALKPAADASATATVPRASGARSGGSAAAGGATTSSPRTDAAPAASNRDTLIQARADCWMKVEHEKSVRDIDRRVAYVDKCVAEAMKGKP